MITLFKDFADTKNPKYVEIDYVLQSIKECKVQKKVDEIRAEIDEKRKKDLKKKLPCILFSGKFTERKDKAISEHSGFVILDFDDVENLQEFKSEMASFPFVYSCFISPSGDGLKVVVKIPADIKKHRGYYKGLVKMFPQLDTTSCNESRICYASIDKDIYINTEAEEFTEYIEISEQKMPTAILNNKPYNNYAKADIALKIIRDSVSGEHHKNLIKASRLMGGFVTGGLISESEAVRLLENEISMKDITSFEDACVAIKKGIAYGKELPIVEEVKVKQEYVSKTTSVISTDDEDMSFLAKDSDIDEYIKQWRDGTFVKGATTGIPSLDKYFVFKRGNYNIINGFDNVGKSTALWYLCLLSAMYNGWSWIMYSNENRSGTVAKKLIEFYWGTPIDKLSDTQLQLGRAFIKKHFTFISNEFIFNYKDILNIAEKLMKTKKYDGMLIDPYNSLKIDLSNNSKLSTHEYHYESASEMQVFTKKHDLCIYLNCHVITGAMRLQKGETKHSAPGKADTEGGGKFSNKADDFMTFHREVQDPDNYTKMQIHTRKIKEVETGGGYTPYNEPYILEMQKGMCSYVDENGFNPIAEYWSKQGTPIKLTENQNFLNEKKPLVQAEEKEYEPFPF